MRIGELSRATGVSVRSLRYYEERGLIAATRSGSGQRHYAASAVARVGLVRRLLDAGLGTTAVADVLPCLADPSSATSALTARLVVEHGRITAEIATRTATRDALRKIIDAAPPLHDGEPGEGARPNASGGGAAS